MALVGCKALLRVNVRFRMTSFRLAFCRQSALARLEIWAEAYNNIWRLCTSRLKTNPKDAPWMCPRLHLAPKMLPESTVKLDWTGLGLGGMQKRRSQDLILWWKPGLYGAQVGNYVSIFWLNWILVWVLWPPRQQRNGTNGLIWKVTHLHRCRLIYTVSSTGSQLVYFFCCLREETSSVEH